MPAGRLGVPTFRESVARGEARLPLVGEARLPPSHSVGDADETRAHARLAGFNALAHEWDTKATDHARFPCEPAADAPRAPPIV